MHFRFLPISNKSHVTHVEKPCQHFAGEIKIKHFMIYLQIKNKNENRILPGICGTNKFSQEISLKFHLRISE